MNGISYVLLFLVAAAVGYGIYKTVKRKGRCACCDGSCPGCRESGAGSRNSDSREKENANGPCDPRKEAQ